MAMLNRLGKLLKLSILCSAISYGNYVMANSFTHASDAIEQESLQLTSDGFFTQYDTFKFRGLFSEDRDFDISNYQVYDYKFNYCMPIHKFGHYKLISNPCVEHKLIYDLNEKSYFTPFRKMIHDHFFKLSISVFRIFLGNRYQEIDINIDPQNEKRDYYERIEQFSNYVNTRIFHLLHRKCCSK